MKRFIGQCNWLIVRYRHSINKPNLNYTSQTKHTTDQYFHTKSKSFTMTILKFLILMFTYTPWARIYPSVLFAIIWRLHLLTVKRPLSAKTNKIKAYSETLNNEYIGRIDQMSSWQFFHEFYTILRKFQYLRK